MTHWLEWLEKIESILKKIYLIILKITFNASMLWTLPTWTRPSKSWIWQYFDSCIFYECKTNYIASQHVIHLSVITKCTNFLLMPYAYLIWRVQVTLHSLCQSKIWSEPSCIIHSGRMKLPFHPRNFHRQKFPACLISR